MADILENSINQYISGLTPEQLLKRYQDPTADQQFGRVYGAQDALYNKAYQTAKSMLGRDPSQNEYAKILAVYGGGSPQEVANANAYLAQLSEQEKYKPENLRAKAGQYSQPVGDVFQQLLQRGATPQEVEHFGSLMASGQLDAYTLQEFLKQGQEYQTGQDKTFRNDLSKELEGYDTRAFQKQSGNVISDYANRGIYNSPSLDFALTDLMGKVAEQRQSFLSNLTSQQYGGNKENARADYLGQLNRFNDQMDYDRGLRQNQLQGYQQRGNDIWDYNQQAGDYMNMLAQQKPSQTLHTRDWISLGLGAGNTAAQFYQGSQMGKQQSPYSYLDQRGY